MSLNRLRSLHSLKWKEYCELEIDGHGRFYITVHQRDLENYEKVIKHCP